MNEYKKNAFLVKIYKGELMHHYVYSRLSVMETDKELKEILKKLSKTEEQHAELWKEVLDIEHIHLRKTKATPTLALILFLRKIFGLTLLINLIEYGERDLYSKLKYIIKENNFSEKEKKIIGKIEEDERENEKPIEDKILKMSPVLNNIRDIIFGMNDGLVEVTAAVAGLGSALYYANYILLGGFIIALSGTMSMAGGAFLSTEYEKNLNIKKDDNKPKSSAMYVGLAYILGSLFPLSPFIFGINGYFGIAISLIITAIVLSIVASIISIISNKSISKSVTKTLIISMGAATVTIILGYYARVFLHITI
ncbi:VIT family transporter [Candidatus Mancarchaeum acidiphilum]|uniref:VIT family transporter n=1 Tax=Candidatus Mancarchaeum acidiphilum TaxID=1920749 RepID=A0A218NNN5_9ARCH|nr:VIT1/CCC1 transporter family protein [Candidatus Mancarchaeum acidiphilum]ASI14062.1 VIT family transporter [Candidatus Mancarchaeum acidiphilum]